MHLGLPINMNSSTTTLPLKLDSNICSPDGLVMVNSGAFRGRGTCASNEEVAIVMHAKREAIFRAFMAEASCLGGSQFRLFPFVPDGRNFSLCRGGSILGSGVVLHDAREHPRDHKGVEYFHPCRIGQPRRSQVGSPMQCVPQREILVR